MNNYQKTKEELNKLQSLLHKNEKKFLNAFENHDSKSLEESIDWGLPFEDKDFISKFKSLSFKKKNADKLLEFLQASKKLYTVSPHFYHLFFEKIDSMILNWVDRFNSEKDERTILADILQWMVLNKENNNFSFGLLTILKSEWGVFPVIPEKHRDIENFILSHLKSPAEIILKLSICNTKETVEYYYNKYNHSFLSDEEKDKVQNKSLKKAIENLNIEVIDFWLQKGVGLPESHHPYAHVVQQMSKSPDYFLTLNLLINKDKNDKVKVYLMEQAIAIHRKDTIEYLIKNHFYKKDEDIVKDFLKKVKKEEIKEIIEKAYIVSLLNEGLEKKEINTTRMKI